MNSTVRRIALFPVLMLIVLAGCSVLPKPLPTEAPQFLPQGWTEAQREAYYHTAQGTQIMPFEWFLALEKVGGRGLYRANENISRYRLLPDTSSKNNPHGLPVGVVRDVDPETNKAHLGFTCAACHSGQINYRGTSMRIDGGEGVLDLTVFIEDMFKSLVITNLIPTKFNRFAKRVLGDDYSAASRRQLKAEVKAKVDQILKVKRQGKELGLYPTADGFGRQDALGHGGNTGFSKIGIDKNLRIADGPVNYPAMWNSLNWDWVQYNGSIRQPMGRNVGEVLGVGGVAVLQGNKEDHYKSTVKIMNLHKIETLIHGLKGPQWPEAILGKIDHDKARRGAVLYKKHCNKCHGGKKDPVSGDYKIRLYPLDFIGTDRKQAENLANHKVDTGDLGLGVIPAGEALQYITEGVAQRKYKELGISPAEQARMNKGKKNLWAANLAYRAHTLDSVWATPPYLHNGAVPNMYELLSPVAERSKSFYTGNLEFDPVRLGYQSGKFPGGFLLRTELPGNSNAGHEFRDGKRGNGVIGPALTHEERMDLIEYMKTHSPEYTKPGSGADYSRY